MNPQEPLDNQGQGRQHSYAQHDAKQLEGCLLLSETAESIRCSTPHAHRCNANSPGSISEKEGQSSEPAHQSALRAEVGLFG